MTLVIERKYQEALQFAGPLFFVMGIIYDAVNTFAGLLDTKYKLILGRKNKTREFTISFDKHDCFHLMGLQYLKDRPELSKDREEIFNNLINQQIEEKTLESSDFYDKISGRVNLLSHLEEIMDSNNTIYKYNKTLNKYSVISADYLLKNEIADKTAFIFLSAREADDYFCRSIFPKDGVDYSYRQPKWTLLYKEKTDKSDGSSVVLYNAIKPAENEEYKQDNNDGT